MIITINGLSPNYQSEKFCSLSIVHERKTEEKTALIPVPFCEIAAGQRHFYYGGEKIFDNLNDVNWGFEANNEVFKKRLNNEIIWICNLN